MHAESLKHRVVVLHHCGIESPHYDLLLEPWNKPPGAEVDLLGWRVAIPPCEWAWQGSLSVIPLTPHRRRYLHYEGPISGGRGSVTQADAGSFEVLEAEPGKVRLQLHLRSFAGTIAFESPAAASLAIQAVEGG